MDAGSVTGTGLVPECGGTITGPVVMAGRREVEALGWRAVVVDVGLAFGEDIDREPVRALTEDEVGVVPA